MFLVHCRPLMVLLRLLGPELYPNQRGDFLKDSNQLCSQFWPPFHDGLKKVPNNPDEAAEGSNFFLECAGTLLC